MYVSSNRPGSITLSYLKDGKNCSFKFEPGKNEIDQADFELIKVQHQVSWNVYYGTILQPWKTLEAVADEGDGELGSQWMQPGEFESFSVQECMELIENTTDRSILEGFLNRETRIGRNRKQIKHALTTKIAQSPQAIDDDRRQAIEAEAIEERYKVAHPDKAAYPES